MTKQILCFLLLSLSLTGCGVMKATESMPAKMDEMGKRMDDTSSNMNEVKDLAHMQALATVIDDLFKSENAADLHPVPTRMMPFGEAVGKVATTEELVKLTFLKLQEINELYPDHKVNDKGDEIPYTADEVEKINHDKSATLLALQIIAGFAPESKVQEMIHTQVYSGGAYEDTVYPFLMMRTEFAGMMLDETYLAKPLSNHGLIDEAVAWNSKIDEIAKLPFASKVQLKVTGFLAPLDNPADKLDSSMALKYWQKILKSAERDFNATPDAVSGDPKQDQAIYQGKLAAFHASKTLIETYIQSWNKVAQ